MSDLDRLIRFAAVAEHLSFTRAATKLHVEAPWLSQQIQQLETQIGAPLLVRDTRRVLLTPLGEALLGPAAALASAAEEGRAALRRLSKEYGATVFLGATSSSYWVPARHEILTLVEQNWPNMKVRLVSGSSSSLLSELRSGSLDCSLVLGSVEDKDLEALVLFSSPAGVLVPAESPLAKCRSLRLQNLKGQRVAVNRKALAVSVADTIYDPFLQAGVQPVLVAEGRQAMLFQATAERLILVSLGWPHSDEEIGSDFIHLEVTDCPSNVHYCLVRRREPMRRPLDKIWSIATEVAKGHKN